MGPTWCIVYVYVFFFLVFCVVYVLLLGLEPVIKFVCNPCSSKNRTVNLSSGPLNNLNRYDFYFYYTNIYCIVLYTVHILYLYIGCFWL